MSKRISTKRGFGSLDRMRVFGLSSKVDQSLILLLDVSLLGILGLFYGEIYSIHQDFAGALLSSKLASTLGPSFADYNLYLPPAEEVWYAIPVWLSDWTGLRLDLLAVILTTCAVLVSAHLAFFIRRQVGGGSLLFFGLSLFILAVPPIVFKNVYGLREHMVILGLWPYLVLRISDPGGNIVGKKTRLILGLWLGATLLLKYLYSVVVLMVELASALDRRDIFSFFRIENFISGGVIALYLFFWLAIDPSQREAIAIMVSAIDGNLKSFEENLLQVIFHLALCAPLLLLGYLKKVPHRFITIGLALVVSAVFTSWMQERWYSHHRYPIMMAYLAWLWMVRPYLSLVWPLLLGCLALFPMVGEYRDTNRYQKSVRTVQDVMQQANISVAGKDVGLLNMHPGPFNQYLAAAGATRWNVGQNIAYVAAELKAYDSIEYASSYPQKMTLKDQGRERLHGDMLRLWEDLPPDALILDQSTSWPLRHIKVDWRFLFANDDRFVKLMEQYQPILEHEGQGVSFTYFERIEKNY
ncbi:hypothetical protein LCM19_05620 [Qipengyuania flava]|nr:hypothetical protein [Qipengyuania flava]